MKKKTVIYVLIVLIFMMFFIDLVLFIKSKQLTGEKKEYPESLTYECKKERTYNGMAQMDQIYSFDYINKSIKNGKRQIVVIYDSFDDYKNYDMDSSFNDKIKPNDIINDDAIKTKTYVWYGEYLEFSDNLQNYIKMLNDVGYQCEVNKG